MIDWLIAWLWAKLMVATGNYSVLEQVFLFLQCFLVFVMFFDFVEGNWRGFFVRGVALLFSVLAQWFTKAHK